MIIILDYNSTFYILRNLIFDLNLKMFDLNFCPFHHYYIYYVFWSKAERKYGKLLVVFSATLNSTVV